MSSSFPGSVSAYYRYVPPRCVHFYFYTGQIVAAGGIVGRSNQCLNMLPVSTCSNTYLYGGSLPTWGLGNGTKQWARAFPPAPTLGQVLGGRGMVSGSLQKQSTFWWHVGFPILAAMVNYPKKLTLGFRACLKWTRTTVCVFLLVSLQHHPRRGKTGLASEEVLEPRHRLGGVLLLCRVLQHSPERVGGPEPHLPRRQGQQATAAGVLTSNGNLQKWVISVEKVIESLKGLGVFVAHGRVMKSHKTSNGSRLQVHRQLQCIILVASVKDLRAAVLGRGRRL